MKGQHLKNSYYLTENIVQNVVKDQGLGVQCLGVENSGVQELKCGDSTKLHTNPYQKKTIKTLPESQPLNP